MIERAVDCSYRSSKNFRRAVEIRCALAEINGRVKAREFVDLDKNRRAKPCNPFCHLATQSVIHQHCCSQIPDLLESQNDEKIADFQLKLRTESAETY